MATKPQRTIPVHVLGDKRIHLAPPHHGHLKQGRLKTLCGKIAVSEVALFAAADAKAARCKTCFSQVDDFGVMQKQRG